MWQTSVFCVKKHEQKQKKHIQSMCFFANKRITGLEPATSTLARSRSTK